METGPAANTFGEFLMTNLRDEAIDQFDRLMDGRDKSSTSLSAELRPLSAELRAATRRALVDAIDYGLHAFLFALSEMADPDEDEGDERPRIAVTVDGEDVAGQSDGLHGDLFGEDGWLATYSRHGGDK